MGRGENGWGDEIGMNGPIFKAIPYPSIINRGANGEAFLQFELMDKRFVDFDQKGSVKGGNDFWSAENIINGQSPECFLKVVGECSYYQSKVPYLEREKRKRLEDMKLKKEIKELKAQLLKLERDFSGVKNLNELLRDQLNRQEQSHRMIAENMNVKTNSISNLKSLLSGIISQTLDKTISIPSHIVEENRGSKLVLNTENGVINLKILPPDPTPNGYLS